MKAANIKAVVIGVLIACFFAPINVSLGEIPITMQTFVLFVIAAVLGKKSGFLVAAIYLIIGSAGIPVFAGFQGGYEKMIGPTAGFLWAFPFVCYALAWMIEKSQQSFFHYILNFFRAHVILLIPGFLVLYWLLPNAKLLDALIHLTPGLLIKSILGGIFSYWLQKKIPPNWTEF